MDNKKLKAAIVARGYRIDDFIAAEQPLFKRLIGEFVGFRFHTPGDYDTAVFIRVKKFGNY